MQLYRLTTLCLEEWVWAYALPLFSPFSIAFVNIYTASITSSFVFFLLRYTPYRKYSYEVISSVGFLFTLFKLVISISPRIADDTFLTISFWISKTSSIVLLYCSFHIESPVEVYHNSTLMRTRLPVDLTLLVVKNNPIK